MRRFVLLSLALGLAIPANFAPKSAQAQAEAPHAWLFGTWTGGLFPVPSRISSQACFAQPVVIFTRDVVMRATLTQATMAQREIATARATPTGAEFRFALTESTPRMFGGDTARVGFGCDSPDDLIVQRRGENEITFPGCADFAYPLVRCR